MEGLAPLSNAPHQLPAVLSVLCAHLFVHDPLHDIDALSWCKRLRGSAIAIQPSSFSLAVPAKVLLNVFFRNGCPVLAYLLPMQWMGQGKRKWDDMGGLVRLCAAAITLLPVVPNMGTC